VEVELEVVQSSVVWVQDMVLGNVDGLSFLVTSMSAVAGQLDCQIDATTANGVRWGSHSALVAVVSHIPELDADLDVLVSKRNAGLIEDEVDALWSWVRAAADSLASHVPPLVARNPPDNAGE
jgi:hypothetical protein